MGINIMELTARVGVDKGDFDRGMRDVDSKVAQTSDTGKRHLGVLGGAALAAAGGAGFMALSSAAGDVFNHMKAGQVATAQTEAVLKSTGGAAGTTTKQVQDLAHSIAMKSGIDDAAVQSGENMLLTFTNVRNEAGKGKDVFNQSTKVLADMSTAMGTDMKTSAIQLGKALNDPTAGTSALHRVGVAFTKGQKEQIKTMQSAGNMAGAQSVILKELQKEFGGSAEAAGKTLPGALSIMKIGLENGAESVLSKMMPALTSMLGGITKMMPVIQGWIEQLASQLSPVIDQVATVVQSAMPIVVRLFGEVVAFVRDNVLPIVVQLGSIFASTFSAIVGVLTANRAQIETIMTGVKTILGTVIDVLRVVLLPVIKLVFQDVLPVALGIAIKALALILDPVDTVKQVFGNMATKIKTVTDDVVKWVISMKEDTVGAINGIIGWVKKNWDAIGGLLTAPFGQVVKLAQGAFGIKDALFGKGGSFVEIKNLAKALIGDVVDFWTSLPGQVGRGISAGASDVKNAIIGLFSSLPGWTKKILGISSPSTVFAEIGRNVVQGFIGGITGMGGELKTTAMGMAHTALSAAGKVLDAGGNIVESAASGIWGAIKGAVGGGGGGGGLTQQVQNALAWAAGHGWHGVVTSGFRDQGPGGWQAQAYAESVAAGRPGIQPNGFPVAPPGTSSHGRGEAVDVTDVAGFAAAMAGAPASAKLYSGAAYGDPIHFSVTGHAKGGIFTDSVHLFGEAGPEALIPLNDPRAKEYLGGGGRSAQVTITGNTFLTNERETVRALYNLLLPYMQAGSAQVATR